MDERSYGKYKDYFKNTEQLKLWQKRWNECRAAGYPWAQNKMGALGRPLRKFLTAFNSSRNCYCFTVKTMYEKYCAEQSKKLGDLRQFHARAKIFSAAINNNRREFVLCIKGKLVRIIPKKIALIKARESLLETHSAFKNGQRKITWPTRKVSRDVTGEVSQAINNTPQTKELVPETAINGAEFVTNKILDSEAFATEAAIDFVNNAQVLEAALHITH